MLEIKEISVDFDRPVLKNISLRAKKGQIIGLVGRSGAGKSTLLNVISGQLGPQHGSITLDNELLPNAEQLLVPGYDQIKLVSQDYNLDPYHTVEENIREAAISLPEKIKIRRVEELLKLLKLNEIRDIKANETSGGEQQRLELSFTITTAPSTARRARRSGGAAAHHSSGFASRGVRSSRFFARRAASAGGRLAGTSSSPERGPRVHHDAWGTQALL